MHQRAKKLLLSSPRAEVQASSCLTILALMVLTLWTLFSPDPEHQLQKLQFRTTAVMQQEVGQSAVVRVRAAMNCSTAAGDQPGAYLRFFV